jgi:hypothetical protein
MYAGMGVHATSKGVSLRWSRHPLLRLRDGTHPLAVGPGNPGLLPRPGRSDRQRRWVPENLGPGRQGDLKTARVAPADSEVMPGPRPPDATPPPAQNHESRAGSRQAGPKALSTSSLPTICSSVEWRGWRFRAQIVQFCAFSAPVRGGSAQRLLATRYLSGVKTGSYQESGLSVAPGMAQGLDPRAGTPGAPSARQPSGAGVPTLVQSSGGHGGLGQAIYRDGGRRRAEKECRGFTPGTRYATLGFAACRRHVPPGLREGSG